MEVTVAEAPRGVIETVRFCVRLYRGRYQYLYLTMPPFRHWWCLFLPMIGVVLDWRDGWSVAIRRGYGGSKRRARFRAFVARLVELTAIVFTQRIVVCTPGLLDYHTSALPRSLRRKFVLIPNGHDVEIDPAWFNTRPLDISENLSVMCAGKFSEYGKIRAQRAIELLCARYPKASIKITLIGADRHSNAWLTSWTDDVGSGLLTAEIVDRVPYEDLVALIPSFDLAIALVRDGSYELGTKAFDYVACGVPLLDLGRSPKDNFASYFSGCFDTDYDPEVALTKAMAFRRDSRVATESVLWVTDGE